MLSETWRVCPSVLKSNNLLSLPSFDGCWRLISDPYPVESCYYSQVFCFCFNCFVFFNVCRCHRAEIPLFYCAIWILVPMEIWMFFCCNIVCDNISNHIIGMFEALSEEDVNTLARRMLWREKKEAFSQNDSCKSVCELTWNVRVQKHHHKVARILYLQWKQQ